MNEVTNKRKGQRDDITNNELSSNDWGTEAEEDSIVKMIEEINKKNSKGNKNKKQIRIKKWINLTKSLVINLKSIYTI